MRRNDSFAKSLAKQKTGFGIHPAVDEFMPHAQDGTILFDTNATFAMNRDSRLAINFFLKKNLKSPSIIFFIS